MPIPWARARAHTHTHTHARTRTHARTHTASGVWSRYRAFFDAAKSELRRELSFGALVGAADAALGAAPALKLYRSGACAAVPDSRPSLALDGRSRGGARGGGGV